MNKRKTIYRGFNKRRKNNKIKVLLIMASVCLISGYGYTKIKDSNVIENLSQKISFLKLNNFLEEKVDFKSYDELGLKDDKKEKDVQVQKEVKEKPAQKGTKEKSEDVKVAVVDSWNIYTIQVASVKNDKDMNKVETKLIENKIPFSAVEMDEAKKVQTYAFFDKEVTKTHMEQIKNIFPDAFVSEMKVPVLSLEYTSKYSYIENISKDLKTLIKNFDEESKFWAANKEDIDLKAYNNILTNRKQIISNIEKEANKIDYSNMNVFKDNLMKYTKDVNDKIEVSSKAANEKNYNISESLYLSSMQGYFSFINSMKNA